MAVDLRASFWTMGLVAAVAAGALGYQTACGSSREPTAIFLGVSSDLVVSEDLDSVGLFVSVKGEVKHARVDVVRPGGELALPGTISILDPEDATTPVHVRVVGYKNRQVVSVRDAVSTVPPNRISVLRLPIQWLSGGDKVGGVQRDDTGTTPSSAAVRPKADPIAGADHFPEFAKYFENLKLPCPTNETMVNGECKPLEVTELLVPTTGGEHVGQVFGGASGIGADGVPADGACFPVATCFADTEVARISLADLGADCTVPKSAVPVERVNFGIRRKACTRDECTIALDYTPEPAKATAPGWYEREGRYQLPKAICDANGRRESVVEVLVTTTCKNKVSAMPTCGPWSAITTAAAAPPPIGGYFDGGANPDGGLDSSIAAAWKAVDIRNVNADVPLAVALGVTTTHYVVGGRAGGVVAYPRTSNTVPGERVSPPGADGTGHFPTFGAQGSKVAAAVPHAAAAYRFYQKTLATSSEAGIIELPSIRVGGTLLPSDLEPVIAGNAGTASFVKVYPNDGGPGVASDTAFLGIVRGLAAYAPQRELYVASGSAVYLVPHRRPTDFPQPIPETKAANPPTGQPDGEAAGVFVNDSTIFWGFLDRSDAGVRQVTLLRTPRLAAPDETSVAVGALPAFGFSTPYDFPAIVGDDTFVFFTDGRHVYGKRTASQGDPSALQLFDAGETVLALAYLGNELFAVTEGGRLLGGPVTLP